MTGVEPRPKNSVDAPSSLETMAPVNVEIRHLTLRQQLLVPNNDEGQQSLKTYLLSIARSKLAYMVIRQTAYPEGTTYEDIEEDFADKWEKINLDADKIQRIEDAVDEIFRAAKTNAKNTNYRFVVDDQVYPSVERLIQGKPITKDEHPHRSAWFKLSEDGACLIANVPSDTMQNDILEGFAYQWALEDSGLDEYCSEVTLSFKYPEAAGQTESWITVGPKVIKDFTNISLPRESIANVLSDPYAYIRLSEGAYKLQIHLYINGEIVALNASAIKAENEDSVAVLLPAQSAPSKIEIRVTIELLQPTSLLKQSQYLSGITV